MRLERKAKKGPEATRVGRTQQPVLLVETKSTNIAQIRPRHSHMTDGGLGRRAAADAPNKKL